MQLLLVLPLDHICAAGYPSLAKVRMLLSWAAALSFLLLGYTIDAPLDHDVSADFPDPSFDPFYHEDAQILRSSASGQVLHVRKVGTDFTRNVASSVQLYYRTTGTDEEAQGTVATVWKPTNAREPAQIFSFATYEDATSLNCNPSWALVRGSLSKGKIPVSLDSSVYIQWALDQGIYVIVPDHEGPKAAWLAGFEAGRSVLDGIRALRSFYELPLDAEVGMAGYSGGAHVTAWAVHLASSYAPEINFIGAAYGGTIFDALSGFRFIDGGILGGFAGAGLVGLMRVYPELAEHVLSNFDEEGKKRLAAYDSADMCIAPISVTNMFASFTSHFTNPDPLNHPIVKDVMERETLLKSLSSLGVSTPSFPILVWHALWDEIVPLKDTKQYVEEQCANGANIQFQTIPIAEHLTALFFGVPGVVNFLSKVFDHSTASIPCGSSPPDFTTLASPRARSILGPDAYNFLISLHGKSFMGTTIRLVLPSTSS